MPSESQQESTSDNMVGGSLEELRQTFEKLTTEYGKFSGKSNKAAGRRARKEAQNMKKLLQKKQRQSSWFTFMVLLIHKKIFYI